jgi:hypothetical protein
MSPMNGICIKDSQTDTADRVMKKPRPPRSGLVQYAEGDTYFIELTR